MAKYWRLNLDTCEFERCSRNDIGLIDSDIPVIKRNNGEVSYTVSGVEKRVRDGESFVVGGVMAYCEQFDE